MIVIAVLVIAGLEVWSRYPVDYLFLPLLLWAGFRAGPRGVTLAATAITVVTILATINGVGSFVGKTANESILLLEGFMAVITFTGLLVVAVRAQQLEADAALEAHNRMLEQRVAERTAEVAEKNRLLEEKQARIDDDLKTAQILQASILPTDFSGYPATGIAASCGRRWRSAATSTTSFRSTTASWGSWSRTSPARASPPRSSWRSRAPCCGAWRCGGSAPADCIARVNEALCRENPIDMFVTVLYAELDERIRRRELRQRRPLRAHRHGRRRQGAAAQALRQSAARRDAGQDVRRTELHARAEGEMLFLYTDGVTEAANRDGDLFRVPAPAGHRPAIRRPFAAGADAGGDRRRRKLLGRDGAGRRHHLPGDPPKQIL